MSPGNLVLLFLFVVFLFFIMYILDKVKKQLQDKNGNLSDAPPPLDENASLSEKSSERTRRDCFYCQKEIPDDHNIEVNLFKVIKSGLGEQTIMEVRPEIPCCSSCLSKMRKETRKRRWIMIAAGASVYLVMTIVLTLFIQAHSQSSLTIWCLLGLGSFLSLLPSLLVFAALFSHFVSRSLQSEWIKKASALPDIANLISVGFRLRPSFKASLALKHAEVKGDEKKQTRT